MSARTELIALLACAVPLDTARDMVDRHHAEVAEETKRAAAVQALGALPMPAGGISRDLLPGANAARRMIERSPEDPHDGPLHTDYATPHDLPEVPAQRDQWGQA